MQTLTSHVCGTWRAGDGAPTELFNPTTEEVIADVRAGGLDFQAAVAHGRTVGGPALRALGFAKRAAILKQLSAAIFAKRDELIELSIKNGGTTRGDAKFDLDGATGTLAAYAGWGEALGDRMFLTDGDIVQLGRTARWSGRHILSPRPGVAVHINAFNFPAWNMMEKAACALLAGVPVIEKPGTSTALIAWRVAQIVIDSGLLPAGAFQFIAGGVGDLLDHLDGQDALAFTGSSHTAALLRSHANLIKRNVRVNFEADSLNAAVLAPEIGEGDDIFTTFINQIVLEMTQKAGQKCTATRRVLVPRDLMGAVRERVLDALKAIKVGDPAAADTRMGPLASARQLADVRAGMGRFAAACETATGGAAPIAPKGWFAAPTVFVARSSDVAAVHAEEIFGPATTLIPYSGDAAEAAAIVARGEGSLVTSLYSNDVAWTDKAGHALAPWTGRIWIASDKSHDQALPTGAVMPASIHGGPGRAGGGEELGGLRGIHFYLQRTAIQGYEPMLKQSFGG